MDAIASSFALSSEQVIQLILIILAVIIALFILRFVVNIAAAFLRTAVWIGLVIIVLYIFYSLLT